MKNIRTFSLLIGLSNFTFANNTNIILAAETAYTHGDVNKLIYLAHQNQHNTLVQYLNAQLLLTKDKPTMAYDFALEQSDGFLRNNTIRQLLIYYYNKKDYAEYKKFYSKLSPSTASINEKCGFDLANFKLGISATPLTDPKDLTSNDIPDWCADYITALYQNDKLTQYGLNLALFNLIVNDKLSSFSEAARANGITPLNFSSYRNRKISDLPNNKYLLVYRIAQLAKSDPDNAYSAVDATDLDDYSDAFLYNYIAVQAAKKQNFSFAIKLFKKR
jgi:hypothetical protein